MRRDRETEGSLILATARVHALLGDDYAERWERVATLSGRDLVGLRYHRPLDWVSYGEGAHEIIVGESFVSADDGSGVVHMAPAFGADDYASGLRNGLAFLQPVDARGRFPETMPIVGGMFVKDADHAHHRGASPPRRRCGRRSSTSTRTRTAGAATRRFSTTRAHRGSCAPRTTRTTMLARNAAVDWHPPEVGSGRFGEWLENNIDWAISRDRYWGSPLPVWVNDADPDEIDVIGSFAELEQRVGRALPDDFDPHKPFIDHYTWPSPSGRGTMRRVPEVIDTWFDSGSMPFAQWHYPFENRGVFARHYPADFIAEGVDQTRGWFYSLLAIATGLGDSLERRPTRRRI